MPLIVDPDSGTARRILGTLPPGCQSVDSPDRLTSWLSQHPDEYVVVMGPNVPFEESLAVCESLRVSRPTTGVVVVRPTLDTQALARAMQAGAREVVADGDGDSVAGAVTRAHQFSIALRGPAAAEHHGSVISVFSPKGGVGKTTIAVNLALALTDKGRRKVCLVDCDLAFGDVAITLQLFPTHTIEHAIGSEDNVDAALLESLMARYEDSLKLLPAPSHPDVRDRISPALLTQTFRTLRSMFDYIVVDTAPSFDEQMLTVLEHTDECVIVATLDVPTLKNVKVALDTLEMLDIGRGHRHLVLNRADDAVGIDADKVEAILGMEISSKITTSLDIAASTNAGVPILTSAPNHPSSVAIRNLAAGFSGDPVISTDPGRHADAENDRFSRLFRIRR